jgi:hypothetical protein
MDQMTAKNTKLVQYTYVPNIPKFLIPKPSKIYQNLHWWELAMSYLHEFIMANYFCELYFGISYSKSEAPTT